MPGYKRTALLARHLQPACVDAVVRSACVPQPAILSRDMGTHQWYIHLSREKEGYSPENLAKIKRTIQDFRKDCAEKKINLVVGFGPSLLKDVTSDIPEDFQNYETFHATDGSEKEAKGTQEELMFWMHSDKKDDVWQAQFQMREKMKEGHMRVAHDTSTFILGDSMDMSGFQDGTGNPEPAEGQTVLDKDGEVAIIPPGQPGAGGSHIIAQRWIHDLSGFSKLSVRDQEMLFGRTKADSVEIPEAPVNSHVKRMQFRDASGKIDEITRRSTPYSYPAPKEGGDGINGLVFIGFCKSQKPLRDRMIAMYGLDGGMRDRMTDFSNPASGAFYFAPNLAVLDSL